ncbi:MAG: cupin domain-containing protein [Bdellovibrionota bacterium]
MSSYLTKKYFPVPVDSRAVAREWDKRGYSCGEWVDPPGQEWINYVHRTNELVTVLDGALEMTVGNETFRMEPGDEAFIPKNVRHTVRNIHSGTSKWLYGYD